MAASAIDLTTADTLAGDLGVASDATVQRVVTAASRAVIAHLRRGDIGYISGLVENVRGYGRPYLSLQRRPILSIASITFEGSAYLASDFLIDDADAGLVLRVGGCWPNTGLVRAGIVEEEVAITVADGNGIVVTYEAGWVTPGQVAAGGWVGPARSLPEDIEEATLQIAANLYRSRTLDMNIQREHLGDAEFYYFPRREALPASALALLAPYVQLASSPP